MAGLDSGTKKGICGICPAGCWVWVTYDSDGRIALLDPDKDSPMGAVCKLGRHAADIIYSKNRLIYPQRRKGPKGTYEFERISWDEAYGLIVDNLKRIKLESGPEACAIYTGVGTFELSYCDIFQPKGVEVSSASSVLFPFGSPNTMGVGALCYVSYGMIAPHVTFGKMLGEMFNDLDNSGMIVVWGTNPATDLPPVDMQRIMRAKERGADVVVIDPRRTQTAKLSGAQWVPIRPGADGALALGMCNVLIDEELYDDRFALEWTHGFDEFARYVQHFRLDVVEAITGIPGDVVVSLARRLASARGASQLMYTGLEYSSSGVQSIRAALSLWALAGQLDVPGGRCFSMPGSHFPMNRKGHISNPNTGPRIGRDRFPLYIEYRDEAHAAALPEAVLEGNPYRIRSLIIQGGSMITSWPEPEIWRRTLGVLDFLVTVDRQLTADAAYADVVLPAATYFEYDSYMRYGPVFKIRERMIEPAGEARGDTQIMAELAARLGYGELYPQGTEEVLRHALDGSGFSLEDVRRAGGKISLETPMMQYRKWEKGLLRKDGRPGFDTPTGKFELKSTVLEEFGYDALPVFKEPEEGPQSRPDMLEKFPLVFNSGSRSGYSFHTQHHGIKKLNASRREPSVLMNTLDAKERGIKDGVMVRIKTARGVITMRARVSDDIMQGAVDANHACGGAVGPKAWCDTNVNDLTDRNIYDPISGFPVYKCLLCDIEPVKEDKSALTIEDEQFELESGDNGSGGVRYVYLDNNATTALLPDVKEYMIEVMDAFGNPSSIHGHGAEARAILDKARQRIAGALNTSARRVIFTGSGSESDNLAIKGVALSQPGGKRHIITSSIEHPAVLGACRWLEKKGFELTYLPVDGTGMVDPDDLRSAIKKDTALVSVMYANNETGTLQPIEELARIAHEGCALMHTDAVQAFGKIPVDVRDLDVDLLSISAHKIGGPKGVGVLYLKRGINLEGIINGGSQEMDMRAGTENMTGIAGFGQAAYNIARTLEEMKKVGLLRDRLFEGIRKVVPEARLNGHSYLRLHNTLNITLPGYRGESMVIALDRLGISLSSGSACKSASSDPSYALLALGLNEEQAHCALRFSLGPDIAVEDIDYVINSIDKVITASKHFVHFVPCR
jgi:cysteine desulfurase NifS